MKENRSSWTVEEWMDNLALEVSLEEKDDFLKVKETLTRIGIPSRKDKKLYQSCHILHKRGKYYITHFKEMFILDGKSVDLDEVDIARRNTIAQLLDEWGLVEIIDSESIKRIVPVSTIKIITWDDKDNWELVPKYKIG